MITGELDAQASTDRSPFVVISADCAQPQEIDDALFVNSLPSSKEAYQVGVCVADTSALYTDGSILELALERMSARYNTGGRHKYVPMLGEEAVRQTELKEGRVQSSLIVSFFVGEDMPPYNTQITFGNVLVLKNLNYKDFAFRTRPGERDERFSRAGAYLLDYLKCNDAAEHEGSISRSLTNVSSNVGPAGISAQQGWRSGNRLNTVYMIGANHLGGRLLAAEGFPAIYRRYDKSLGDISTEAPELGVGYFSAAPGRHDGLRLDPYPQITSPLRRLQDFVMNYALNQRHKGLQLSPREAGVMNETVERLNARIDRRSSRHALGRVCITDRATRLALQELRYRQASDELLAAGEAVA